MNREPVVQCRNIRKRYGGKTVLDGIDVDLQEGEVFGLLGPNGAGKTTFIKVLLGLTMPTTGTVRIFDEDLFVSRRRLMRHVGAVVEAPAFFNYLDAFDNLDYLVALTERVPHEKVMEALTVVGLADVAHGPVGTFSYGMKQRLGIAQALLPDTRFLVLDEPTNGLDPHGIAGMRKLIRGLSRNRGITVLVSSHLLTEVEQVCDRVMIIHEGRNVLESTVEKLRRDTEYLEIQILGDESVLDAVDKALPPFERRAGADGEPSTLCFRDPKGLEVPDLVRKLVEAGLEVHSVRPRAYTLEDIFISHTRSENRDVRIDAFRD